MIVSSIPPTRESDRAGEPDPRGMVAEMAELIGGLAHELRNPLSTMMVQLKLLAEELEDESADPDHARRRALVKVAALTHEAERLQILFDQFLNLTDPSSLERCAVDVNAVVARTVDFFAPTARSDGVDVSFVASAGTIVCPIDERRIRQALLNLLINARQAMPDGGTLRVETAATDAEAIITVADTGHGIAEEDRQRILRPFFSTKATGSGLGLSITQRIIRKHGGSLYLESVLGHGTTCTIRLPRRLAAEATGADLRSR